MKKLLILVMVSCYIIFVSPELFAVKNHLESINLNMLIERSVLSKGNTSRLIDVIKKARGGEDIVIGVIGGSITSGQSAKTKEESWAFRMYQWWGEKFPNSTIKFVNAGVGGTGSDYGAHRVYRDLLKYKPDFIVAEFSVNDPNTEFAAETLEGMIRQILKAPNAPALMLLFMTYQDGRSAQEWHSKVGSHYGISMISYRDAIMPEIKEGKMEWVNISSDIVHPNAIGHYYCAKFITAFLDSVVSDMAVSKLPESQNIPEPLISDTIEYTAIYRQKDIQCTKNTGWTEFNGGWKADIPGSELEFEVTGKIVSVMFNRSNGNMGQVEASIDGKPPTKLDGWFNWAGVRKQFAVISRDLKPGKHILRIQLTNQKDTNSKGHRFELDAIMVAGLSPHAI